MNESFDERLADAWLTAPAGSGSAPARIVAEVRHVRNALENAINGGASLTGLTPRALESLKTITDVFLAWHRCVERAVAVDAKLVDGYRLLVEVRYVDGTRSAFEVDGKRWRRSPGVLCSELDVALETGESVAYVNGLMQGLSAVASLTREYKHSGRSNPDFANADQASKVLGLPVELIESWAASGLAPHYSLPGSDARWFRIPELRKWIAAHENRRGGLDVPAQIIVKPIAPETAPLLHVIPLALRDIPALRQIDVVTCTCGIYFLCDHDEVVYVGQSTSIHSRVGSHVMEGIKKFNRAFYVPCRDVELDRLERELIDTLMPKYNADALTQSRRAKARAGEVNCV